MTDTADKNKKYSEWLIMIYMAGDNNLSANTIAFLQELEDAGHDRNVRVLAGFDSATPLPKGPRYVEINRHLDDPGPFEGMRWELHNDLVSPGHIVVTPDFCESSGTAQKPTAPSAEEALARFLDFARRRFEAKRYMLILFGHGPLVAGNTFLTDTNPPSFLELEAFANILHRHFRHKIDILGFDNCVMNGIETAVQLGRQVDFTIGSQGIMLALGWPFGKIIRKIRECYGLPSNQLAEKILRVCARNLLDYSLMERSSEQAICDLSKFGRRDKFVSAVRALSKALQKGLEIKHCTEANPDDCEVRFPLVRDVVRLARLEAQAYFGESFVDIYDFCELLVLRSNDVLASLNCLVRDRFPESVPKDKRSADQVIKDNLLKWPDLDALRNIVEAAWHVLNVFREEHIVPHAYYVCPELQYSHGVSVYFPWTLPAEPLTFEPVSWGSSHPRQFRAITPFERYRNYLFAHKDHGDWAAFLESFFRATLRNVRRFDLRYDDTSSRVFLDGIPLTEERVAAAIDLRKTDSDSGEQDECECPPIKNYPRRFYLSPADCKRRMPVGGLPGSPELTREDVFDETGKVNYLGWNIRGIVAEEIDLPARTNLKKSQLNSPPSTNDSDM
jgi:hypothetical protein